WGCARFLAPLGGWRFPWGAGGCCLVRGSSRPWGRDVSRPVLGVAALCAVPRAPGGLTFPVQFRGVVPSARFPAPLERCRCPSRPGGCCSVRGSPRPWRADVSRPVQGVVALCAVPRAPGGLTFPVPCRGLSLSARFPAPLEG